MSDDEPKWRRRKTARPAEIIAAALDVFVEKGFAATKLDDVARRAGIAKGTLYLYFETKEDLFRAVARAAVAPKLEAIERAADGIDGPFAAVAPLLLTRAAAIMGGSRVPAVARMVIGESRNFPDLARIWHEDVVARTLAVLTRIIARAQASGEVVPGDPRLHAFSLVGPLLMAMLFREVFGGFDSEPPDLPTLAGQHARTLLRGLLTLSK